jgi:hypothetical protein
LSRKPLLPLTRLAPRDEREKFLRRTEAAQCFGSRTHELARRTKQKTPDRLEVSDCGLT